MNLPVSSVRFGIYVITVMHSVVGINLRKATENENYTNLKGRKKGIEQKPKC